jgi:hypothetical protein
MDILSKDALAIVQTEAFKRAVKKLLEKSAGSTTTVEKPESDSSDEKPKEVVTLRRLSV